ncbi:GntR family transcriptional regulator [Paracoccus sp. TK19116]|uniref:GntR family transcriptional regulator n=1 Tax=Paracoccus albicereus TaxID=2922394 RepID=A0ABT1MXQ9_9RHOB|nr:GntR family transcriptional regulator [Paracoccus albicereus]MCQ0972123.1 GntR family transcriptional regulator [Paracoccus albicereus]
MLESLNIALPTIDQTRPIAPQLHRRLRERIIRNELRANQKISESEIAEQYGVSRQPVREAFIRLAEESLVAILPQRGTRVRPIALSAVRDARFIREAIEADIVTLLAQRPDPLWLAELRRLLDEQRHIAATHPQAFIAADEDFHRTLSSAAGKSGIWQRVQGLKSQMDRVRFLSLERFDVFKLVVQHEAIVDGIAIGDPAAAESAMRLHLREILKDLPIIATENPDVFDEPSEDVEDRVIHFQGGERS